MVERKHLDLLQFDKIIRLVVEKCHSPRAVALCQLLSPQIYSPELLQELEATNELKSALAGNGFFPTIEYDDVTGELSYLTREGSLLHEEQLLALMKTIEVCDSLVRFLKNKKANFSVLARKSEGIAVFETVVKEIGRVIDHEGQVKDSASPELYQIRKDIRDKRKESDKRFYHYISLLRKHGYLRENEESFFNGRRTLAVLIEHKSEVPGFVHGKSESGKTIFIEPGQTMSINNDIAELEIDERREVNRVLRELCSLIRPEAPEMLRSLEFLVYVDFVKAKAKVALDLKAILPHRDEKQFNLKLKAARHPLLFLQNKRLNKPTVPLDLELDEHKRILVISGPNAGGKTIALKTVGLLQCMLQSGMLIPVAEDSRLCFFEKILIDIGDTQSIENELSTYSAKLKTMTVILNEINDSTLVLMDEFGSGTDPELGSAIAEAVLESLVSSKTKGIITSHFGDVKLLAEKLEGAINGSMLFNLDSLEPKYILSVGEPGSSYTFEVAERIGFPRHLIERAKKKVDKDKLKLNKVLAEVQDQKAKLAEELEKLSHEQFLNKMSKEKYHVLFDKWEEKINKERERKIELARLADYGQKYLRLMEDWNQKKDRKEIIKRFIDGITAESKKQELLRRQNKMDKFAEKKIARIKPNLKVGSKVKILNGNEIGVVEDIKEEKVFIRFGLMKMTVGMQNLVLADD